MAALSMLFALSAVVTLLTDSRLLAPLATRLGRDSLPAVPLVSRNAAECSGAAGLRRLIAGIERQADTARGRVQPLAAPPHLTVHQRPASRRAVIECANAPTNVAAVICYTLDGSLPTIRSRPYRRPLALDGPGVIRARTFRIGFLPSRDAAITYLPRRPKRLPVVSLIIDPELLTGRHQGIVRYHGRRGRRWEQPALCQVLSPHGETVYSGEVGLRVHGGSSRSFPKKSYRLYWRAAYGDTEIRHTLFTAGPTSNRVLILDSGGSDQDTQIKDAVCASLWASVGGIRPRFCPCVLLVNGANHGVYFIRERIDIDFLHRETGLDEFDLLDGSEVLEGSREAWSELETFCRDCDPNSATDWSALSRRVDLDNFTEYNLLNIILANRDWRFNNDRRFQAADRQRGWRWIPYDCDNILRVREAPRRNPFQFPLLAQAPEGFAPSQHESHRRRSLPLLRVLLEREEYRIRFLSRLADRLNSTYSTANLTRVIDSTANLIRPDYGWETAAWSRTRAQWEAEVESLHDFAKRQPRLVFLQAVDQFGLPGLAELSVAFNPTQGQVWIGCVAPDSSPWTGTYFQGLELAVRATARHGYRFAGWAGAVQTTAPDATVVPRPGVARLEARFETTAGEG